MATLFIRNLPLEIYRIIKKEAKVHRRSVNHEAVVILEELLRGRKEYEIWNEIDMIREKVYERYGFLGDSVKLIREDRKR